MSQPQPKIAKQGYRATSGTIAYLLVMAIVFVACFYSQSNLLFVALGLGVVAFFLSLLLSYLMMRRLSLQRIVPAHGVAGEPMVLRYRIFNHKRWLPVFNLVILETWGRGERGFLKEGPIVETPQRIKGRPAGWVMHLGPNQPVLAESPCWPLRRGVLDLQRVVISTNFPFGIIKRYVEFSAPEQVLVYPHLFRVHRRILHRISLQDLHGRKKINRGGGQDEFFSLRHYRPGDSLKIVDWKRTAKSQRLVSREMISSSPPTMMVALDLRFQEQSVNEPSDSAIERAISLCASLICDAHINDMHVGLSILGSASLQFPPHHSLPHRTRMLEALSRVQFDQLDFDESHLPIRPSVIVTPDDRGGTLADSGIVVMGAGRMEHYGRDAQGAARLLNARGKSGRPASSKLEPAPWN